MKKILISAFFAFFTMVIFSTVLNAQQFNPKYRYWSIGGSANIMNYVGDLDPGQSFISPNMAQTRWNFGITVMYRWKPRISFRGTFAYGRVGGDDWELNNFSTVDGDIFRKIRNLSFFNDMLELKADVVIDFIEHRGRYQKRPDFIPFAFIGVAGFYSNPQAILNGTQYSLRDYRTEGQGIINGAPAPYSLIHFALPVGVGIRYKLSKQLDLSFEIGWRFTSTDYIDDVAGYYVNKQALYDGLLSADITKPSDPSQGYSPADALIAVYLSDRSGERQQEFNSQNIPGFTYVSDNVGGTPIVRYGGFGNGSNQFVDGTSAGANNGIPYDYVDEKAPVGSQHPYALDGRGEVKELIRNDAYIVTGFHLTYIIPQKVICPKFR